MAKKRVGRPELEANQRRSAVFRFVTTQEEGARIRAKAKNLRMTLSEYLRSVTIPRE